jgi:ATP-dependent DNA ligase
MPRERAGRFFLADKGSLYNTSMPLSQRSYPLPMLARSSQPFDDSSYIFETKWDGVRAIAAVGDGGVRVWGRKGADYTGRYPELDVLRSLPAGTVLDGELVLVRAGRPDFYSLMRRHARRAGPLPFRTEAIRYVAFDVLYLGGRSLLNRPLSERRTILHDHVARLSNVELCAGVIGDGISFFRSAVSQGHEGVVAKRLTSRYLPNQRTAAWNKIKQLMELPCVVIGYRRSGGEVSALLMAALVEGETRYVGPVELGFSKSRSLLKRLESLHTKAPPVSCSWAGRWLRPELFCVVRFAGWRPGRIWRDAVVVGWEAESRLEDHPKAESTKRMNGHSTFTR